MKLRKSKARDLSNVIEILYENSKWMESKGIFQWPLDWLKSQESGITEEVKSGNFYIHETTESVLGILHLTEEMNPLWKGRSSRAFYLSKIAVRLKNRKQNIGGRMIKAIESKAEKSGICALRLDCVSSNQKLKEYYQSKGFAFVTRKDLPEVSLDLYEKKLKSEPADGGNAYGAPHLDG